MPASSVGRPSATRPSPQVLHRVRAGLCVLTAVLTEIVLIAAVGNQASATAIAKHNQNPKSFAGHVLQSLLTYRWRFAPLPGDTARLWPAELARLGTVLVLTGLLVWAIARGVSGFVRVFLGTWMSVVVATDLAQIVYGLVLKVPGQSGVHTVVAAFFGGPGPSGTTLFAALMLGFVAGLLTAIVAMASRRRAGVLMAVPPGTDEADTWLWGDEDYRAAAARSAAERWPPRDWSDSAMAMPGGPPYARGPQSGPPPYSGPPHPGQGGPPPQAGRLQVGPSHREDAGPPAQSGPPPGRPPQRPAPAAEDAGERTQAYDFSEDPDLSDDVAARRDVGDQPTQQLDLPADRATQHLDVPPERHADQTREFPTVREE